ncbi:hypothetical protein JL721_5723 [Aureococcus anophagefferens]|nr:hypothetical protein JL721_5723 [Aureococcus anophagefferens]
MAELGDFICQGRVSAKEVSVEMMDYTYVDKCEDLPELRSILKELKTGTYGRYPHLEGHVEKKILNLLPPKERAKYEALTREPTALDARLAREEVESFSKAQMEDDERLRTEVYVSSKPRASRLPPPLNAAGGEPAGAPPQSYLDESEKKDKKDRISGYDFRSWDTFDVDAECSKVDEADKTKEAARKRAAEDRKRAEEAKARRSLADLKGAADALGVDDLAPAERAFLAAREKHKGNEAYKAGESRDAYDAYTRSLAYDGANAVVFANRAMASIRLGLLERAEDDCTCALKIDPDYAGARQRRGMSATSAARVLGGPRQEEGGGEARGRRQAKSRGQRAHGRGDFAGAVAKYGAALDADAGHYASRANRSSRGSSSATTPAPRRLRRCLSHAESADAAKRVKALFRRAEAREGLGLAEAAGSAKRVELLTGAGLDLEAVCKLEPKNDVARNRLRTVSAAMADATDAAAAAATRAAELGAFKESDAKKAAGSEKMKAGDLEGAVACYTAALELWDGNVAARNNRALARLKLKDFDGAVADASAVLVKEPANLKALYRRGVARRATGDLAGSLDDLDALLVLAPGDRAAAAEKKATRAKLDAKNNVSRVKTKASSTSARAAPREPKKARADKAEEKRAAAVRAAAKRNVATAPKKAPKTATELELAWRDVSKDPKLVAAYVATFKPLTLKKIDVSLMSEVFSQLIPALIEHRAPPEAAAILANAAKHKGFTVTRALLSKAETVAVTLLAAKLDDKDLAKDLAKGYGLGK